MYILQVNWSNLIGEPESYQSPDLVWKISSMCFTNVQNYAYKLLTIIFAPLFSIIMALAFAVLVFLVSVLSVCLFIRCVFVYCLSVHCVFYSLLLFYILFLQYIWCISPLNKFFNIIFSSIRTFLEIILHGILGPIFETIGSCLSNIKIRHQKVHDVKEEPQFPFII